jgi:pimeloyl-ACP methyl ester carboxylesterase
MPIASVNGVDLYYEETGQGFPLVWSHEFGGDSRSWEPQVRYFSRRYRVITYNHRGYPPSEVPKDPRAYSSELLVEDLHGLLRHLGIRLAHVAGLSMGANVALNLGLAHPELCRSLVIAGCGSGTTDRETFLARYGKIADDLDARGMEAAIDHFSEFASRRIFLAKDPRGWAEFATQLRDHSALGSALTLRGVQLRRKTIVELESQLRSCPVPALIISGDQDEPCLEPSLFLRRHLPHAGLLVLPVTGHTTNIEEPGLFNLHVEQFLAAVENGRWGTWTADSR